MTTADSDPGDGNGAAPPISVYVCSGCSLGERLDLDQLAQLAQDEAHLPASVHPPLCIPEGVEALRRDIAQTGARKTLIAACSPRVNWDVFSPASLAVDLVERVNIRELVAWSKPANDEETQALAADYLRMGIAGLREIEKPRRTPRSVETTLLVVGGGVTGLTAAQEAADAGHDVVLVEQQPLLGGWMARFYKRFPTHPPYTELEETGLEAQIRAVQEHPRIRLFTNAELTELSGEPGAFLALIRHGDERSSARIGAVVLATGWQPLDTSALGHLGAGRFPDVITNLDLERLAAAGPITRPSNGRPVSSVAFVQRPHPPEEHPYSHGAAVIDTAALKQALYLRERNPDARAYILYEDIVTPGHYEDFYRRVQQEPNTFFVKGEVSRVDEGPDGDLLVTLQQSLLGAEVQIPVDLVVLALGMAPSTAVSPVLQLLYRQGPGLPQAKYGFSDSNFICFPYESQRTGLYAAGTVREPMDLPLCQEDASGAALKAIQSLTLVGAGASTHPRAGDLSLPETRLAGCTQCGRCSQECPFSAIEVDDKNFPVLKPDRCRRCGICMGSCPVQVISFEDYSVPQLSAMIKAIHFPDDDDTLRILALVCENDAYPAFDIAGINRLLSHASVRVIPLRCLGSLNQILITDALSRGIDGILLMGCKTGDDYQCHFIKGSELAIQRMENVRETLDRLALEAERVQPLEVEISDYDRLPALIQEFVDTIHRIGPNPFKGL